MLASLDRIDGVEEARVDHSGKYFLLALGPGVQVEDVLEAAREELGDAERVEGAPEAILIESYRRGEEWLGASDAVKLSREEARILAQREGEAAAETLGLDPGRTEKLVRGLEEELIVAFERIHARGAGLGEGSRAEFAAAGMRLVERSRAFLSPQEVEQLEAYRATRMAGE